VLQTEACDNHGEDCMSLRRLLAVAVAFVLIQAYLHAQARPHLAGTWALTAKAGVCSASLTILQDESSLRVQVGDGARVITYSFDGTDTREVLAPAPARPPNMPSTAYVGHKTSSVARAAWNGDRFVIVTHSTMTFTWPSQVSGEFERETTSEETYSSPAGGQLIVDHRVVVDPLPGGTARRIDVPDSWTCAYTRAGEQPSLFMERSIR
jgi:hypothetical protein